VEGVWVPTRVHGEILSDVRSSVTDAAEFGGSWAGTERDTEKEVGDGVDDCDAGDRGGEICVEAAIGRVHVSLIYPDDFVGVAEAYVMESV
jgi:hypothetical protein